MANKEFIQRLKEEHSELLNKASKLQAFIESDNFDKINFYQQGLLPVQLEIMNAYLMVLEARLRDLSEEHNI